MASRLLRLNFNNRFDLEYRMRTKSGEWRWILDRGSVIPGPDGKAHRMIGEMLECVR